VNGNVASGSVTFGPADWTYGKHGFCEAHASPHTAGLPAWLVEELTRYQHIQQRNWRPARLEDNIRRFWSGHLRVWRFLVEQCGVRELSDVRRKHLYDYAGQRLSLGRSVSFTNSDLRAFHSFMVFLQEEDYAVPQPLLRIHGLKQPNRLPQHLTDEQIRLLRDDFERRVRQAIQSHQVRDALLDRAVFHLLWQSGLRLGDLEELHLEDLDLSARKLSVRNGKGMKDRTVYMTDTTVHALRAYLEVRGIGPTDHVFLYRNQALKKDLTRTRIKDAGKRVGVKVYPHRLRHTCGTQLLNSGCPVTSIQKLLGHKKLNTTMVYARAYDKTVEADYFAAMGRIEQCLELVGQPAKNPELVGEGERVQLLGLAEQLFAPELGYEKRLEIAVQMCGLLGGGEGSQVDWIPPPAPVPANAEIA
jgi:integrase/recombinase XerD